MQSRRRLRFYRLINRNNLIFATGLGGIIYETVLVSSDRPTLLILFGAMLGLPAFLSPASPGDFGFGHRSHPPMTDRAKELAKELAEELQKDGDGEK